MMSPLPSLSLEQLTVLALHFFSGFNFYVFGSHQRINFPYLCIFVAHKVLSGQIFTEILLHLPRRDVTLFPILHSVFRHESNKMLSHINFGDVELHMGGVH